MITTVLDNIIAFHGKEYRQTKGVAIGSILGRNFACCGSGMSNISRTANVLQAVHR